MASDNEEYNFKQFHYKVMAWISPWVNRKGGRVLRRTVTSLLCCLEVVIAYHIFVYSYSIAIVFFSLYERLAVSGKLGNQNATILVLPCDIASICCRVGEHRGELQGSNAIHEILKEQIAFLSGIWDTANIMLFKFCTVFNKSDRRGITYTPLRPQIRQIWYEIVFLLLDLPQRLPIVNCL